MGRDRRNEHGSEHWTKMIRPTMDTDAWRALSPTAQALYTWLKFEWRGPRANNNGTLSLSLRQAAKTMGVRSPETVARAFRDLQAKGFVVVTKSACLGTDGHAKSFEFELTELVVPGRDRPRQLFKKWRPDAEFEVARASANNPNGKGGKGDRKEKPHPQNRDNPIPEIEMKAPCPSTKSVRPNSKMEMKSHV